MSGVLFLLPGTSVADVAAAVRVEIAAELARLDVAVSSRATNLDVTTATASVAPAVRVELAPEMARVDAPVSSRASREDVRAAAAATYGGSLR